MRNTKTTDKTKRKAVILIQTKKATTAIVRSQERNRVGRVYPLRKKKTRVSMTAAPIRTAVSRCEDDYFRRLASEQIRVKEEIKKTLRNDTTRSNMKCVKCHKKTARYVLKQTRAADEGSTVYGFCTEKGCKHKWSEHN